MVAKQSEHTHGVGNTLTQKKSKHHQKHGKGKKIWVHRDPGSEAWTYDMDDNSNFNEWHQETMKQTGGHHHVEKF